MLILSASVMRASSMCTRWPIGSDRVSQGHEAPDADGRALPAAGAGPPSTARASGSARTRNPATAAVPGNRRLLRRLLADEAGFVQDTNQHTSNRSTGPPLPSVRAGVRQFW